jgi:cytochrome c5
MSKTCHASSFVAFPLLTAPQRSSASVATRNHKGLHLASMDVATQWDKIFQKILFEKMSKICHASMFCGIPTSDSTPAQQHLCSHEESQGARFGEYEDCHTVGQF